MPGDHLPTLRHLRVWWNKARIVDGAVRPHPGVTGRTVLQSGRAATGAASNRVPPEANPGSRSSGPASRQCSPVPKGRKTSKRAGNPPTPTLPTVSYKHLTLPTSDLV